MWNVKFSNSQIIKSWRRNTRYETQDPRSKIQDSRFEILDPYPISTFIPIPILHFLDQSTVDRYAARRSTAQRSTAQRGAAKKNKEKNSARTIWYGEGIIKERRGEGRGGLTMGPSRQIDRQNEVELEQDKKKNKSEGNWKDNTVHVHSIINVHVQCSRIPFLSFPFLCFFLC